MTMAVLCAWPVWAGAQQAEEDKVLRPVVVTATRIEEEQDKVPGTVTTLSRQQIELKQARNLNEALADEPDVTVSSDPRRFGAGNVNIRGIEENRVLMLTDGVRASDFRAPGTTNYDANNRDVPFMEFLKQVEIVRGASSSLYGSDAIGGVLGFLTLDPADVLKGRSFATGGSAGYHSVDSSWRTTAYVAGQSGDFQSLLMVGRASGEEVDNQGTQGGQGLKRTEPNPLSYEQYNVLAKFAYRLSPAHRFKLTLEHKYSDTDVDQQRVGNTSATSPTSLTRITTNTGTDTLERNRMVFDYDFTPANTWFDRLSTKAFVQKQETDNSNFQLRTNTSSSCSASTSGSTNCAVDQRFLYEQTHLGLSAVQDKSFDLWAPHTATWGLDLLRVETEEKKETTWTNLATGATSNVLVGDAYPRAEYPKGHSDQMGLFVQDEIRVGKFRFTPGLRYDDFSLEPEDDPLYTRTDGREAVSKSGSRVSPKLAGQYNVNDDWNLYAQYAEGFRGPNYEEVNRYFYNSSQKYAVIGNPDLKPETSHGFEIGTKYGGKAWGSQFSLYQTRYSNFIDYVKIASTSAAAVSGYSTYQYQNLSRVVIRGGDWRGYWQPLSALRLSASAAIAHGTDQSTGNPLNSIEPRRMSLAAQWTQGERWGAEWRLRAATGKDQIDTSSTDYFRTPGYGVNDLSAWVKVQHGVQLNFAVNNIFDKTYYLWSDVRRAGLTSTDPAPEFYTQPGRNFALTLKLDY